MEIVVLLVVGAAIGLAIGLGIGARRTQTVSEAVGGEAANNAWVAQALLAFMMGGLVDGYPVYGVVNLLDDPDDPRVIITLGEPEEPATPGQEYTWRPNGSLSQTTWLKEARELFTYISARTVR